MPRGATKPVEQLQFRRGGEAERRTLAVVVPPGARTIPACPRSLKGIGRVVWRAYWSDPVSLAATAVDAYDVHRYCALVQKREALERVADAAPLVEGYAGMMLNPRYKLIHEYSREIELLRNMLGILPLARMKLGLVQAQTAVTVGELKRKAAAGQPAPEQNAPVVESRGPVIDLELVG